MPARTLAPGLEGQEVHRGMKVNFGARSLATHLAAWGWLGGDQRSRQVLHLAERGERRGEP